MKGHSYRRPVRVRVKQILAPRWRIADVFNRSARWCWADLVEWALHRQTRRDRTRLSQRTGLYCQVQSSMHRDRICYCGKFRDGQLVRRAEK